MAKKEFFKTNPTLNHSQTEFENVKNQDSLDPQSQNSLDPETVNNEKSNVVIPEMAPSENNQVVATNSFLDGNQNNIRPQQSGILTSEVLAAPDVKAKKKRTGLMIALIAVLVLLIGCGSAFGYVYHKDKEKEEAAIAADKAAAQKVADMIASIGEVSLGSSDQITEARSNYDALTVHQKEYVPNLADLTTAEKKYEEMKAEQDAEDEAEAKAEAEAAAAKEAAEAAEAAAKSTLVLPNNNSYYGTYQVYASGGLVLRYGPSKSYNKILTIPDGTYLDIYGWSGEWCYVTYNNHNGWVSANYLY